MLNWDTHWAILTPFYHRPGELSCAEGAEKIDENIMKNLHLRRKKLKSHTTDRDHSKQLSGACLCCVAYL